MKVEPKHFEIKRLRRLAEFHRGESDLHYLEANDLDKEAIAIKAQAQYMKKRASEEFHVGESFKLRAEKLEGGDDKDGD